MKVWGSKLLWWAQAEKLKCDGSRLKKWSVMDTGWKIQTCVMGTGSSSSNRRLVVAFCITLYFWFAFFDDKEGLDPEEVGGFFLIDRKPRKLGLISSATTERCSQQTSVQRSSPSIPSHLIIQNQSVVIWKRPRQTPWMKMDENGWKWMKLSTVLHASLMLNIFIKYSDHQVNISIKRLFQFSLIAWIICLTSIFALS